MSAKRSVGVMAYVLLTGFTPFGGDTDQETFQNICHGQLDFPDELFEDISPQAEDFIRKTLSREPRYVEWLICLLNLSDVITYRTCTHGPTVLPHPLSCRPTVKECLKHPWLTSWKNVASHQRETISSESQRKNSAFHHNGPSGATTLACPRSAAAAASINGHNSSSSSSISARSLQRAMSKSREVLYERVAASNLRKSTSKSRERLCEMRLSVSRSRDHLCDVLQPSAAQSRERLHSLRNLSKSHEVLSLLNEQGSAMSAPSPSGSLFNILPSTQSLECFTIPSHLEEGLTGRDKSSPQRPAVGSAPKSTATSSDDVDTNPTVGEFPEINKVLSESTETLCDETETATQPDEITPSNSRSETPTQERSLKDSLVPAIVVRVEEEEEEEDPPIASNPVDVATPKEEVKLIPEPVSSRADAVASSLKRLSSNGPPPLKMPTHPSESLSPAIGKSGWNWPTASSILLDGAAAHSSPSSSSSSNSKSPVSPTISAGYSARKHLAFPSSSPVTALKENKPSPTSPSPPSTDESMTTVRSSIISASSSACSTPSIAPTAAAGPSPVEKPKPPTPASTASIDTASLTDSQRQLLTSCLNRRRASWACGTRQEDVSSITNATSTHSMMGKQAETKLSVSELITSFNQCQLPGASAVATAAAATSTTVPCVSLVRPSCVKKMSVGTIFHQGETATVSSAASTPSSSSISKIVSEKEKTVFKPVSTSIQVFQKNLLTAPVATSTSLVAAAAAAGVQRSSAAEVSTRPRSHHLLSWDMRALPRLPEDSICSSPRQEEEATTDAKNPPSSEEAKDPKSTAITASEVEEDFGLRSGSVSSDTGCSSSSDLSDRSSDEGLDATREPRRRNKGGGVGRDNGSEPEADLIEGALTSPPVSWTGRPRSFSVQSEISLLAQPWNRVCIGSVARAFEKFGTKVDGDVVAGPANNPLASTSSSSAAAAAHRSRRQSTPGPFK